MSKSLIGDTKATAFNQGYDSLAAGNEVNPHDPTTVEHGYWGEGRMVARYYRRLEERQMEAAVSQGDEAGQ